MVDFRDLMKKSENKLPIDPLELYKRLDSASSTGPLRTGQIEVLKQWYTERKEKENLVIKMHTGDGKTLVGLLLLYSNMIDTHTPCMFVAPTKQLKNQAIEDAIRFGIPYTDDFSTGVPTDYLNGEKILITHVHKVFNGKSIFNRTTIHPGIIVIDDAHACMDSIRDSSTITILRRLSQKNLYGSELYNRLLHLFRDDIVTQGEHLYQDIENSNPCVVQIPYWAIASKSQSVLEILYEYIDEDNVKFALDIVKKRMKYCSIFFSENKIQIMPDKIPMDYFKAYKNAAQIGRAHV